jgi:hypothetical protein
MSKIIVPDISMNTPLPNTISLSKVLRERMEIIELEIIRRMTQAAIIGG